MTRLNIRHKCTNPDCCNHKYARNKELCPECKGLIALRHTKSRVPLHKLRTIRMIYDPALSDIDLTKMHEAAEPITVNYFLRFVPISYVKTYFGYKAVKSRGLTFQNDDKLRFYKSIYKDNPVFYMEKDGLNYVFAEPIKKSNPKIDRVESSLNRIRKKKELSDAIPFQSETIVDMMSNGDLLIQKGTSI